MKVIQAIANKEWLKRHQTVILFAAVHILLVVILVFVFNVGELGDTRAYFDYSSRIIHGEVPYRDFDIEYPPLSLLTFIPPRLLTADLSLYSQLFTLEILFFDLIGLVLIAALARRWGLSQWQALGIYTVVMALLAPVAAKRYDLLPAVLMLFALYAFARGWDKASWAALALGTMAKLYPVLLAPFFIAIYLQRRERHRLIRGGLVFALTVAAITVVWLVLSPSGFVHSLTYHTARPLQIESTYASFLLLGHTMGLTSLSVDLSYGSWNLASPAANALATTSTILMFISLALIYWGYVRNLSRESTLSQESNPGAWHINLTTLFNYSLLVVLAFIVTSKVFSPQFLIWLCPLIPFVMGRWRYASWLLFIITCTLTLFIFPLFYPKLVEEQASWIIVMLFLRNLLLIAMAYFLIKWKYPQPSAPHMEEPGHPETQLEQVDNNFR